MHQFCVFYDLMKSLVDIRAKRKHDLACDRWIVTTHAHIMSKLIE